MGGGLRGATNFAEVAKTVTQILSDDHYYQQDFGDAESRRALGNYLEYLDFQRLYFTQAEVEDFQTRYAEELDDYVSRHNLAPAHEIYNLYAKKMKARYTWVEALIKSGKLDFNAKETVEITRKKARWAANEGELDELWRKEITREVLQERLNNLRSEARRKEKSDGKPAEEPTKTEPAEGDVKVQKKIPDSPEQKVMKRQKRYYDTVIKNDEEDVANFFLSAITTAYDPHSEYFSAPEASSFNTEMVKALIGIGAVLAQKDGAAEIRSLVPGGPADKSSKLRPGDLIIGVGQGANGEMEDVEGMKLNRIVEKIRGGEGTTVRLKVQPADEPTVVNEISITREKVDIKDTLAKGELIEISDPSDTKKTPTKVGWIKLDAFYADMENRRSGIKCSEDVKLVLQRLMKEGAQGMLLDLRGNGGGSLEEAIRLTGLFLDTTPVVLQQDKREKVETRTWKGTAVYRGPLVVMIDRGSASASEIFAAALQDTGRALVVGDKSSFGKGTVQAVVELSDSMAFLSDKERAGSLKLTIGKFFRINGQTTQLEGVESDVKLPSMYDGFEVGEEFLTHPLPATTIKPAIYERVDLGMPYEALKTELGRRSMARVKTSPDFTERMQETTRRVDRIKKNILSINEAERIAEDKAMEERTRAQRDERRKRVEDANKSGDPYRVYPIEKDTVDKPLRRDDAIPKKKDATKALPDEDEEDEVKDEYPHGIDPVKKESLNIMQDMVELIGRANERTAQATQPDEPRTN